MTMNFHREIGYSTMNTIRSALSTFITIDGFTAGQHPLIKRFMRGVFNLKPSLPRYNITWDTNIVLDYIKTLSPVKDLNLKLLTMKLVMLLSLLTGQRCQTLHFIRISDMSISNNSVKIRISDLLKHSRPGVHLKEINIKAYAPNRRLCIVKTMQEYLTRTKDIRPTEVDRLLISFTKPHKAVTTSTVSRWIKCVLKWSGIDTSVFGAHSTRSAATTKANLSNVPLATVMRTAGWSRETTFRKYYEKQIQNCANDSDFAKAVQTAAAK